jgi:hypothetical protein
MRSSSFEDEKNRSPKPSQSPPNSNTDEQGRREEVSDGDLGDGGDPDGTGGGVLTSLGEGLSFAEGEHERLVHLLSSIDG